MLRISRKRVIFNVFGACISSILDFLSKYYNENGIPQLAVFSHDHISNRINVFGRYEGDNLYYIESLIKSRKLGNGACLDIGANVGNHALFFSHYFQMVHAFEPARTPYDLLKINAGLKNNIICHPFGLSDKCGTLRLSTPIDNIGMGSFDLKASSNENIKTEKTLVMTLDSLESLQELRIELIKIDVEGHELAVLIGASETIKRNKPIILFEQQAAEFESGTSRVIEQLQSYGYINFYCYTSWSRRFPNIIGIFMRVLFGDKITLTKYSIFEPKYYSMIIAIHD